MEKNKCNFCNSRLNKIVKLNKNYTCYICSKCSLIVSLPIPNNDELIKYYQGFLFDKPSQEEFLKKKRVIENNVKKIISQLKKLKKLNENTSILDYGGGTGFYSNAFKKYFKTYYYDIDQKSKDYVKENFNFNIIEDINENDKKFDIIFCNNVIEHVKNPKKLIIDLKNKLTKGGLLILITPNQQTKEYYFRFIWLYIYLRKGNFQILKFLKNPWIACDPPRHIYSFNQKNIKLIAKKLGFERAKIFSEYSVEKIYSERMQFQKATSFKMIIKNLEVLTSKIGVSILKKTNSKNKGDMLIAILKK